MKKATIQVVDYKKKVINFYNFLFFLLNQPYLKTMFYKPSYFSLILVYKIEVKKSFKNGISTFQN